MLSRPLSAFNTLAPRLARNYARPTSSQFFTASPTPYKYPLTTAGTRLFSSAVDEMAVDSVETSQGVSAPNSTTKHRLYDLVCTRPPTSLPPPLYSPSCSHCVCVFVCAQIVMKLDLDNKTHLNTMHPAWLARGMSQSVIDILSGKGITGFTPVQAETFVPAVSGRDVIGRSRTGTGKTLAFGMPAVSRLRALGVGRTDPVTGRRAPRGRLPSMLVLAPTRELARQVSEELAMIAKPMDLDVALFHGGVSYDPQARALSAGVDIIVATPGRCIDHINRGTLKLADLRIAVLDEADEMLNMGFADDVETIMEGAGSNQEDKPQVLLFSATTPDWVTNIAEAYQRDALKIDATNKDTGARTAKTVRHMAIQIPPSRDERAAMLEDIIAVEISKDSQGGASKLPTNDTTYENEIAAAAIAKKASSQSAMSQKIFGKTIVFTQTKKVGGGRAGAPRTRQAHATLLRKEKHAASSILLLLGLLCSRSRSFPPSPLLFHL